MTEQRLMRLASVCSFTQVIKSCWRARQGCSVSLGSFAALYETGSSNTKAHMCSHLKICSRFPSNSFLPSSFFFLSLFQKTSLFLLLFFMCLLIFSLSHSHPSPQLSLLFLSQYVFYFNCLFLHFTSFFPAPSATPLFSSLRKSHSLIWDMLDLVSLKATLLTPCLPLLRTAHYLKQFHHSPGFVRWNVAHRATFHSLRPLNANPLPDSPSSRLPPSSPFSFSPSPPFWQKCLIYTYWVSLSMWRNANVS